MNIFRIPCKVVPEQKGLWISCHGFVFSMASLMARYMCMHLRCLTLLTDPAVDWQPFAECLYYAQTGTWKSFLYIGAFDVASFSKAYAVCET